MALGVDAMTDFEMMDDCCDKCEMDFYQLIEWLINDIQHLESKVVYLRYSLSKLLPEYDGEMLRCDIFSDLSSIHYDQPAYQRYVSRYCGGHDPVDDAEFNKLLMMLSRGEKSVNL